MPPTLWLVLNTAVLTSLITLTLTWWNENLRARRRRQQVASALVFELRTFKRQATNRQRAAERREFIMDIGFSRHLYDALLVELPFLGSDQFLRLRAAYQQLAQVNFLLEQFATPVVDRGRGELAEGRIRADRREEIGVAYTAALRVAQSRIDEALTALRAVAPARVFEAPLPEISELTEKERALFASVAQ